MPAPRPASARSAASDSRAACWWCCAGSPCSASARPASSSRPSTAWSRACSRPSASRPSASRPSASRSAASRSAASRSAASCSWSPSASRSRPPGSPLPPRRRGRGRRATTCDRPYQVGSAGWTWNFARRWPCLMTVRPRCASCCPAARTTTTTAACARSTPARSTTPTQILEAWPERHGETAGLRTLRLRQLLYRVVAEPAPVADKLRDHFGANHWHEAEVEELDPTRPTRLADGAFDGAAPAPAGGRARQRTSSQVTDEGLYELLATPLDPARRRVLLGAARPHAAAGARRAGRRGSRPPGRAAGSARSRSTTQLTLEQLHALGRAAARAARSPRRGSRRWSSGCSRRAASSISSSIARPAHAFLVAAVAVRRRAAARDQLAQGARAVAPARHRTPARRWRPIRRCSRRTSRCRARASYVARDLDRSRRARRGRPARPRLPRDHRAAAGRRRRGARARPAPARTRRRPSSTRRGSTARWLDAEIATAHLLQGARDADRATLTLGPARAAALRERIELAWCPHNPTRFGVDEPVVLEVDVKHVPELVVKVFRIDPLAYFQHQRREVDTDLDLDGLAASHEQVLTFAEPPVRRVRRRIELPMCARPGHLRDRSDRQRHVEPRGDPQGPAAPR